MSVGHLNVFFGKMFIQIFCPFFLKIFIYLFIGQRTQVGREAGRERERERERERSRLCIEQRAQCRAQSQDPGIMTWAEGIFCPFLITLFIYLFGVGLYNPTDATFYLAIFFRSLLGYIVSGHQYRWFDLYDC